MSPSLDQIKKWIEKNRSQNREDYFHFLRFRSISADPSYEKEVRDCAEWLHSFIAQHTGMKTEKIETEGYPLIYAENLKAGRGASTLAIYGHYDVQPVDPIDLWESDPFEPTERKGRIYARGAVDDKGQIFYAVLAAKCWKELGYELPINLKFCIEGEEESSSVGLSQSLPKLKEKLKSDYLLVVDFDQFDEETPAITLGARGIVALEVSLIGSNSDLHSGMHGGLAYNPNRALAELISKLWDQEGRVQVKGFYDDVVELSPEEKKEFAFRFDIEQYKRDFGVAALGGEKSRSKMEANNLRPTLEINGLFGGYTGPGVKTVIPAKATAKITCRLVPNQDPQKIARQVADFLKQHATAGMEVKVEVHPGEFAFRGNPKSEIAKAVEAAAEEICGKKCQRILSGGSIPVIAKWVHLTQAQVVGMGYGLPTDNIHAPNEHFDFHRFEKGLMTVARALEHL